MAISAATSEEKGLGLLSPAVLMEAAQEATGLSDFGERGFVEPLDRLAHAIRAEAGLTEQGTMGAHLALVRCLSNRLRLQADLMAHPEILGEDIVRPVVIIGLPRTGTSKLQRMLSADPDVQRLYFWRLLNPAPLPGWHPGAQDDERIEHARAYEEALKQSPDFASAHPMAAEVVDEDAFLMEMAFDGILPLVQYRVPSFHAWTKTRPRYGFYEFERLLLQYLQWQDGGSRGRPWILKAQTHLGGLEALVDTFPDVTVVHCHRDIPTAMTSTMRTGVALRSLLAQDIDLVDLGQDFLNIYTNEMAKYLDQRARLSARLNIVDVAYRDIVDDPATPIAEIYRASRRQLTTEAETAMHAWEQGNPQYRFGRVTYSPDQFGVTTAQLEAAFSGYIDMFGAYL